MEAKPSLRRAVNRKCFDCTYDPQASGTWRQQVDFCPATACPLHGARPRSKPRKNGLLACTNGPSGGIAS